MVLESWLGESEAFEVRLWSHESRAEEDIT